MKKSTKVALITGIVLIVLGFIITMGAAASVGFRFSRLSTTQYTPKDYPIPQQVGSIRIEGITAEVRLVPSQDDRCTVVCAETDGVTHSVSMSGDTLNIERHDNRRWYDFIGISWNEENTGIVVALPRGQYDALQIDTDVGDVHVPAGFTFRTAQLSSRTGNISFGAAVQEDLSVETSTGACSLLGTTARSITATSSTGEIELKNVVAEDSIRLSSKTGDMELEQCDAGSLTLESTTGDIEATLLSGKDFRASSSTGDIQVPPSASGGSCTITTTTGDIEVSVG